MGKPELVPSNYDRCRLNERLISVFAISNIQNFHHQDTIFDTINYSVISGPNSQKVSIAFQLLSLPPQLLTEFTLAFEENTGLFNLKVSRQRCSLYLYPF